MKWVSNVELRWADDVEDCVRLAAVRQRCESLRELFKGVESEFEGVKVFCLQRLARLEKKNIILSGWRIKNDFFLALNYNAQPYIDVHCSNEDKIFTFSSTIATLFFICSGAKNSFLAPLLLVLLETQNEY